MNDKISYPEKDINEKNHDKKNKNKIKIKNTCLCCLIEVEGSKRCSQCETAIYCGKECQLKHWPVHKNSCQESNSDISTLKLIRKADNHFQQGSTNNIKGHHY